MFKIETLSQKIKRKMIRCPKCHGSTVYGDNRCCCECYDLELILKDVLALEMVNKMLAKDSDRLAAENKSLLLANNDKKVK